METKIKAEYVTKLDGTHFFGNTTSKEIYEFIHTREFDKREIVAPKDIDVRIKTKYFCLTIHADALALEYNGEDCFYTIFTICGKGYELSVKFDNNEISEVWVEEWFEIGYFEDGDPADKVYSNKDNTLELVAI